MSEIEKMYKNAGVEPEINYVCDKEPCEQHLVDCQECSHLYDTREDYPDFTAEKQIELLKLILKNRRILDVGYNIEQEKYTCMHYERAFNSFEEALCTDVNYHWQDLTEEEKQQVKGILE